MGRASVLFVTSWLICVSSVLRAGEADETHRKFEYWPNGNYKSSTIYDTSDRVKAKAYCRADGSVEKIERFDKYGNKVQEAFYDEKGMLKTGIDGWAAKRWWYDGSQLMSQISYDEDGRPIERMHYSDSGKLLSRQYSDSDKLNPYEQANMAMMLGQQNVAYYRPERRMAAE